MGNTPALDIYQVALISFHFDITPVDLLKSDFYNALFIFSDI
ncbi:hypothetical protein BH09BAC3_BH09BAC3_06520 [soil metagenome]